MERIYHRYELWEDFKAGFYNNVSGELKKKQIQQVVELFSNKELTEKYMQMVIDLWHFSCEHNLTNEAMNRIAYLGQAACCMYAGISSTITMEAWHLVSKENRDIADSIASKLINNYKPDPQRCLKLN